MKRYCLFIILAALFFSSCEEKSSDTEYIYQIDSPLTVVTTVTQVPSDTYSEYMETYTPPTTTGTDVYYFHLSPDVNSPSANTVHIDIPPMDMPQRDTAARPDKAERPDISSDITTITTSPDRNETEETGAVFTEFTLQLPETDAVSIQTVPRDTAPIEHVPHTAETTTDAPIE